MARTALAAFGTSIFSEMTRLAHGSGVVDRGVGMEVPGWPVIGLRVGASHEEASVFAGARQTVLEDDHRSDDVGALHV